MLTGRRALLLVALAPALALGSPAGAQAACGVASARAVHETPEVQVYTRATKSRRVRGLVACHRATGKAYVVGVRANDGMGTDEFGVINGVLGGRWIWTSVLTSAAESSDAREDTLTDLRSGRQVSALVEDEFTDATTLAVPGALLVADKSGLAARFTDGRRETLSTGSVDALSANGARVYWREQGVARTAVLTLPAADPARRRPLARTTGRCKPRRGARLILRADAVVLSRAGGNAWACRTRTGKTYRLGAVDQLSLVADRFVVYAKPGIAGVFDVERARWRELESTSAAFGSALVAAGPGGVRAWGMTAPAATVLASEPATEVAVGDAVGGTVAFWLDAAGTPRLAVVPG